jgi:hypothetical protein
MKNDVKFKVGDVIQPKESPSVRHQVIGVVGDIYILERLDGSGCFDKFEIELVDFGGRKLTKLELALK